MTEPSQPPEANGQNSPPVPAHPPSTPKEAVIDFVSLESDLYGDGEDQVDPAADVRNLAPPGRLNSPTFEVVRSTTNPDELRLLHWERDSAEISSSFRVDGIRYEPPAAYSYYKKVLILPTEPKPCGSTRALFRSVNQHLAQGAGISAQVATALAFWSLTTWCPDHTGLAPALILTGAPSGADRLLRALQVVTRTPMLLAGSSTADLMAIPIPRLQPTLLLAQPRINPAMISMLATSTRPGYSVAGRPPRGSYFDYPSLGSLYCPKAVYLGEDPAAVSRLPNSLYLHLPEPVAAPAPTHLEPSPDTLELQNQLLWYRLVHRSRVAPVSGGWPQLSPSMQPIASIFSAVIFDDPSLTAYVGQALQPYDDSVRAEQSQSREARILETILKQIHEHRPERLFIADIADALNQELQEERATGKLSPEEVGHSLRRLGLPSRRLTSSGRGLLLDASTVRQLHRLAKTYEVLDGEEENCDDCRIQLSGS